MWFSSPKSTFEVHFQLLFLLCDLFMWVCSFCSKIMIDLIVGCTILELVSCVTLFGSKENARKNFHFVLRLSCLRKFNIRKLGGLRNSSKNLIWFDFFFLFFCFCFCCCCCGCCCFLLFRWISRDLGFLFHDYDCFDCWLYYFRTFFCVLLSKRRECCSRSISPGVLNNFSNENNDRLREKKIN